MNREVYTEDSINIKEIIHKFRIHWYYFAVAGFLALTVAFFVNRYKKPVYKAVTSVLIQDDRKGPGLGQSDIMEGFGLFASKKNLENEIGVLNSYALIKKAIIHQKQEVTYLYKEKFIEKDLYNGSPFIVEIDTNHTQLIGIHFNVSFLSDNKIKVTAKQDDVRTYDYILEKILGVVDEIDVEVTAKLGEFITHEFFQFRILLNPQNDLQRYEPANLSFVCNDINKLTLDTKNRISISPINKDASIVDISLEGSNIEKTVDFLNILTGLYLMRNLEKKNEIAIKTIRFIDDQLSEITDSLHFTENKLQNFRLTNKVMDMTFQAQKVYERMQELEMEKAVLLLNAKYYDYLKKSIAGNSTTDDIVAPSSMGINDQLLNSLILELNKLINQKNTLEYTSKDKNPQLNILNIKIQDTKKALKENIFNIIETSKISIDDINKRQVLLTEEINKMPRTERELFGIERKFKLNDAMYTYLLQKRSEAQIAKASNMSDNEVLDIARMQGEGPVSPKRTLNYLIAFFIGFVLPGGFIFIQDYMNDKIVEREDIHQVTHIPILGHIIRSDKVSNIVVSDKPNSPISEAFRSVRTNLQFILRNQEKHVILITSSLSGEGKTFCAINLASIYALFGKKTILLGFDLRRPKIYQDFNLSNAQGISTFLINKSGISEIIQKSPLNNLDVMMAGPVPPNPAEIIASERTNELFEALKEKYDYIIVDTSPIGLVADAKLLMKYADISLYVVRQNFTNKDAFSVIINDVTKNAHELNLQILINDVKLNHTKRYSYGYGYGYGDESERNHPKGKGLLPFLGKKS